MTDCQSTGRDDKSVRPKGNYIYFHSPKPPLVPVAIVVSYQNLRCPLPLFFIIDTVMVQGVWWWVGLGFMAHIKTPFYIAIHVFVDDKGNIMFVCLRARFLRRLTSGDRDDWYHINKRLLPLKKKKEKMPAEYRVWVVNVKIGINAYIYSSFSIHIQSKRIICVYSFDGYIYLESKNECCYLCMCAYFRMLSADVKK